MQVQVFLSTASIFTLLSGLDNPDDDGDNAPAAPKRRRRCTAEMEPAPEAPPSATPAAPSSAANAADLDVADSLSSDNEFDFNFLFGSESEMLADPPKEHKKKKEKKKKDKKLRKKNKKKRCKIAQAGHVNLDAKSATEKKVQIDCCTTLTSGRDSQTCSHYIMS